jgi:hypothetical protein
MTNNLTLSCVVTVDLAADKYQGEIFITDDASVADRLGLILTAKAELEEMADAIVRQYTDLTDSEAITAGAILQSEGEAK